MLDKNFNFGYFGEKLESLKKLMECLKISGIFKVGIQKFEKLYSGLKNVEHFQACFKYIAKKYT